MSFLKNVFNRKEHTPLDEKDEDRPFSEEEEDTVNDSEEKNIFAVERIKNSVPDPEDKEEYEVVEREILPAKIICPDCGGITLEGLDFCDKCGGELK